MLTGRRKRNSERNSCRRLHNAQLHAHNQARVQAEREDMARRWKHAPKDAVVKAAKRQSPAESLAEALRAMRRDFGGPITARARA